jgi:ribosomal protein S18 acetylase RimI-like enzyme
MNIKIRKSNDVASALKIAENNSHFFNAPGLVQMKKDLGTDTLIGAYENDQLCGFVALKELNEKAVELSWMAVNPSLQGQGIGTSLVEQGFNLLQKRYTVCQMKTLSEIDPDPQYSNTRKFYIKLGFIPLETINPYPGWGDDNPCQIFVKILSE